MAKRFLQSILIRVYVDDTSGIDLDNPQTAIAIDQACEKLIERVKLTVDSNLLPGLYAEIVE